MLATLLVGIAFLLAGCGGGAGISSSVSFTVVGLWLLGISLTGFLAGCGGGGSTASTETSSSGPSEQVATQLAFITQPTSARSVPRAVALTPITPAPQVEIQDADGHRVADATNAVTISLATAPAGAVLVGTTTVNAVDGVATFSDLAISISGDYTLVASANGLDDAGSVAFTTTPLPLGFTAAAPLTGGGDPARVITVDLNRDGNADLVAVGYASSSISVFLGNGDGTFAEAQSTKVDAGAISVVAGQFNTGNDNPDLAVSCYFSNTVTVLLGNGDGTFTKAQSASVTTPGLLTTGLVDGDAIPDIVAGQADYSNFVTVLLGNGDGTFQDGKEFAAGTRPMAVALGDLDGDGKADLAAADLNSGNLEVLLGNGAGGFGAATEFPSVDTAFDLKLADLNGDDVLDAIAPNRYDKSVSVLLGDGKGSFTASPSADAGNGPFWVDVADLNADGIPDIAVANIGTTTVSVVLGNGDGTFQAPQDFTAGAAPSGVAIGDFNGDHKPDLAISSYASNDITILLHD